MNWQDERWVKLYTRDTGDWLFLSFDAQALFLMLLRKVDRHGRLALGKRGLDALPQIIGHVQTEAVTRVTAALAVLIGDGCVAVKGEHLIIPNFEDAQEALTSNAERQRRYKEKQKVGNAVTLPKTRGNEQNRVEQNRTEQTREDKSLPAPPAARAETADVWDSYSDAYELRHKVRPPDSAKGRSQIKQFLGRVPKADAPSIAAFFLTHNDAEYVRKKHPIDLLLLHAAKLYAEWKTGRRTTTTDAHQQDRTQANLDGWLDHMSPEGRANALAGK